MSKRFIAYFIGVILATVAFVGTAQAQEFYELPFNKPCADVGGEAIEWMNDSNVGFMMILECGCWAMVGFDYAKHNGEYYICVNWVGIIKENPNCDGHHTHKDEGTGKVYKIEDYGGLQGLAERQAMKQIVMAAKMNGEDLDLTGFAVHAVQASCREAIKYPSSLKISGKITLLDPIGGLPAGSLWNNEVLIPQDWKWTLRVPCLGSACCISHYFVQQIPDSYPVAFERIVKSKVLADELSGNCDENSCSFDCTNLDYDFNPSRLKYSLEVSDATKISVSPNPNNGLFSVFISGIDSEDAQYIVSDILGNVIIEGYLIKGNNDLNLSDILSNGTYTVTIYDNNTKIATHKVVVIK